MTPDCGDNSCEFAVKRGGMRTNGGCRCLDGLLSAQRWKVRGYIADMRADLAAARDTIVRVERECNRLHEHGLLHGNTHGERLAIHAIRAALKGGA